MNQIKFDQVQGILFSGYNKYLDKASYYLLKIENPAKTKGLLNDLLQKSAISHGANKPTEDTENCINIAISYSGLIKLGLDTSSLCSFEPAFRDGMHSKYRSARLGDTGANHPDFWHWGNQTNAIDILFILFSKNELTHKASRLVHEEAFSRSGLTVVRKLESGEKKLNARGFPLEHFGFAESVSNPEVIGFPNSKDANIATGEFLLGYPNQYDGKLTKAPQFGEKGEEFGFNGTYLVLRQLEQNVSAFWRFVTHEAKKHGVTSEYLAAKFVGRWKSGALVEPNQHTDPQKDTEQFDFTEDPHGYGCPLGSHIRRSNPRAVGLGTSHEESLKVANRHRIMRRGRSYGDFVKDPLQDDVKERGLLFVCLNANIERQFEFIQHSRINNVKFGGLYDESDPLVGGAADSRRFTIQEEPLRRKVHELPQFVTTRGGAYFFLPSLSALKILADA